jgi:hypothetical protein
MSNPESKELEDILAVVWNVARFKSGNAEQNMGEIEASVAAIQSWHTKEVEREVFKVLNQLTGCCNHVDNHIQERLGEFGE